MTDTPADTASEAITQADRDAVADCLGDPMIRAGRYDHQPLVQAFARHRRLTSHSAGEGLREALRSLLSQLLVRCSEAGLSAFDELHKAATAAIAAGPMFTPPSDAGSTSERPGWAAGVIHEPGTDPDETPGSTTRSGGEGVHWRSALESIARPFPVNCNWEDQARACQVVAEQALAALPVNLLSMKEAVLAGRDVLAGRGNGTYDEACTAIRQLIDVLATAPSPDASPDSGEALRAGFETWAKQAGHPLRQSYGEYDDKLTHVAWCAWAAAARPSPSPAIVKEAGDSEEGYTDLITGKPLEPWAVNAMKSRNVSNVGDGGSSNIRSALTDPATRRLLRGIITEKTKVGGYPDTMGIAEAAYALARPAPPSAILKEAGEVEGYALLYKPPCDIWYVHSHKLYETPTQARAAANRFLADDTPIAVVPIPTAALSASNAAQVSK